ncbi:MAG: DUF3047 domain-containing protein [Candidatus Rokuibacteriota bacterium]
MRTRAVRLRLLLAAGLVMVTAAAGASAADLFVVEDWKRHTLGASGLPEGWRPPTFSTGKNDFTVVENDTHRVLHMRSRNDSSAIIREIKKKVNLKETPILEWSWRVVELPKGGNSCQKATDDQAGQIYVVWEHFPSAINSRVIGYIWDSTAPAGTVCKSEKSSMVTYMILRSGPADLKKWVVERRNVVEDYKKVFGEAPDNPDAISIAIDSDDVKGSAETFFGSIVFKRP